MNQHNQTIDIDGVRYNSGTDLKLKSRTLPLGKVEYIHVKNEHNNTRARAAEKAGYIHELSDDSKVPTNIVQLRQAIIKHVDSTLHVTSSAPIGSASAPLAVVDEQGRLRKVHGLRVADASIFLDVPSVTTNPTVIMAAGYIADMIRRAEMPDTR